MIIGARGGHSKNAVGAVKLRKEYECMQELFNHVVAVLRRYGHTVIDCNSNANNENAELAEGARKANAQYIDYFISLHMNAFDSTANGVEVYIAEGSRAKAIAERLCKNFASLGLKNRGVKYKNLYEMRNIKAPNIVFETLFCDNGGDVEIWAKTPYEDMALLIANAIDPNIPIKEEEYTHVVNRNCNIADDEKFTHKIDELKKGQKCYIKYTNKYGNCLIGYSGKQGIVPAYCLDKIGEEKPVEPPKDETLSTPTDSTYYRVVAGSYTKRENAEKLVSELKSKGYSAFIDIYKK